MSNDGKVEHLKSIAKLMRHYILVSTTQAGSGHPTSFLSAVELMSGLLFGGTFRYDLDSPEHPNDDRLIFSKGHTSPLFYSLWGAAGKLTEADLMTYRHFGSHLEGHPTVAFLYVDAATGSLGQGQACRKKIPFVSTFSAFMSRAYDQIRMSQYSDTNIKFVWSHAGVSIGEDGPSQMELDSSTLIDAFDQ